MCIDTVFPRFSFRPAPHLPLLAPLLYPLAPPQLQYTIGLLHQMQKRTRSESGLTARAWAGNRKKGGQVGCRAAGHKWHGREREPSHQEWRPYQTSGGKWHVCNSTYGKCGGAESRIRAEISKQRGGGNGGGKIGVLRSLPKQSMGFESMPRRGCMHGTLGQRGRRERACRSAQGRRGHQQARRRCSV